MTQMIMYSAFFLGCAAFLAAAFACIRLLRGPMQADRIVALDIFLAAAITLCLATGLMSGRVLFLDVAIALAIANFVATLGWARLIELSWVKNTGEEKS
ncbi:MAG: monovalent cation/H+ antiporter complex subunit F [bacterium]|nr:monovalent cation/H+ antiporter complex subunit F [bacterium]